MAYTQGNAGIVRINGTAQAGTFHGGYQLRWFKFAGAGFYTDGATGYTNSVANSVFEQAVRGIESIATVVVLGTPTSAGFTVGIDAATSAGRGDATGYAGDTSVADLDAAVYAASGVNPTTAEIYLTGVGLA
jgi:hypothetical protein